VTNNAVEKCVTPCDDECPDDRHATLKIYISELIRQLLIHTSSIRNNTLHELTLIKLTVAHFVATRSVLIRYSNEHTK
jgi:hypothetical protein